MSSVELSMWLAFEKAYGLPDAYFLAGLICSTLASIFGNADCGPEKFVPYFRASLPPVRENTDEQNLAIARQFAEIFKKR